MLNELEELENESLRRGIPILGKRKGLWLYNEMQRIKPKQILELGTANGYSGIILAGNGGKLTTIEKDGKMAEEARNNFEKFNVDAEIIKGDAVEEVRKMVKKVKKFDIIFIDFAKKNYMDVLEDCMSLIKINGYIIADNVNSGLCENYKEAVLKDKRLKTEIIDLEDGLALSKRTD